MADKESSASGIVQEIAKTLAMIQHLRAAAWSYSRIAVHLNESGIPSLTRWKGQPARWHGKSVKRFIETAPASPEELRKAASEPPDPKLSPDASSPPALDPSSTTPAPTPIEVKGRITVKANGVAITLVGVGGTVTVTGPFSVEKEEQAEEAEPHPTPLTSSIIHVLPLGQPRASPGLAAPVAFPHGLTLMPSDPFFLRRRV